MRKKEVTAILDIIIVNFNSTGCLMRCLESVYNALGGMRAEISVQDNASDDGVERVLSMFPKVLLTKNSSNLGFARAVNKGLRKGSAPYVLLLNPDSLIEDVFFEKVFGYMEEQREVGILGPKVLNSDESVQGSARTFPTILTGLFGQNAPLTKILPGNAVSCRNILSQRSDGRTPMEVDWVSGACMIVRRKAIGEVGLLDPRFFVYWEDADWCRRMWRKGWKVVYFPAARVVHHAGASSSTRPLRSLYQFHKSSFKLFYKHAGVAFGVLSPIVAYGLFLRFGLVAMLSALSKGGNKKE